MNGKIIQLDEALSNKIAAGEVVERPASVVKELLKTQLMPTVPLIEIEVMEAGLKIDSIIDNGDGLYMKMY